MTSPKPRRPPPTRRPRADAFGSTAGAADARLAGGASHDHAGTCRRVPLVDRTMAIAAIGWIGEDMTGVRVVDLVAGLQYDLSVPVPARLVGVDSGVVLLAEGHGGVRRGR